MLMGAVGTTDVSAHLAKASNDVISKAQSDADSKDNSVTFFY